MFFNCPWKYCLMQVELKDSLFDLLLALNSLPASWHLPSITDGKSLRKDLLKLIQAVDANDFDIRWIILLLQAVHIKKSDYVIWDKVYAVIAEYSPTNYSSVFLTYLPFMCQRYTKPFQLRWTTKHIWASRKSGTCAQVWAQFKSWAWLYLVWCYISCCPTNHGCSDCGLWELLWGREPLVHSWWWMA